MTRGWRRVVIWDAALIGAPLLVAAILALNHWTYTNERILLLASFGLELAFVLAGGSWLTPGFWPGATGIYGIRRLPTTEDIDAALDRERTRPAPRVGMDPIGMGPGVALAALLLSFAVVR